MKEADTSIVSQPSIDEPTALRKAQYGAAQETDTGDIGRDLHMLLLVLKLYNK